MTKLIVAYPQPANVEDFERAYQEEHVPLALDKLRGMTKLVATKTIASPQGTPAFYRVAEVYFPSMKALEECAGSEGGKETLANAMKISSGGPPVIMIAEEETFNFGPNFHSGGHMPEVVYRSEVRIERVKGPVRRAYLPAESQPVTFGVHGAVAEHYKVPAAVLEPHATTLDYIVAAAAGGLTGTFGGALEARQIDASAGSLVSEAQGEIELEDNVLVIRRIHVRLKLRADESHWETAHRVHGFFADRCPVYRSLKAAIVMSTELILEPFSKPGGRGSYLLKAQARSLRRAIVSERIRVDAQQLCSEIATFVRSFYDKKVAGNSVGTEVTPLWVAEIWRYAVESMGGEPLKEALLLTTKGIDGDRVVQVWARTGRFFTARTRPKLLHHWATLSTEGLPLVDGRPYPIPGGRAGRRGRRADRERASWETIQRSVSISFRYWWQATECSSPWASTGDASAPIWGSEAWMASPEHEWEGRQLRVG